MSNSTVNGGMSVRYKTKACKVHSEGGICNFGSRCCFAHSEREMIQGKISKLLDDHPTMNSVIIDVFKSRGVITTNEISKPLLKSASDDVLKSKIEVLEAESSRIKAENEDLSAKLAETTSLLEAVSSMTSMYLPPTKLTQSDSVGFTWTDEEEDRASGKEQLSWTKVLRQTKKS